MNGPTMRRRVEGSARRTVKPPRSAVRGTITSAIASQEGASPGSGLSPLATSPSRGGIRTNHLVAVERLARDAALGVAGDFFHPHLGIRKQRLAALLQRLAALVNLDRFLERDVALLQPLHDRLQFGERLLERQRGDVGVSLFFIRHALQPCISAPTWAATDWASPSR